jgi:hypothetical protein
MDWIAATLRPCNARNIKTGNRRAWYSTAGKISLLHQPKPPVYIIVTVLILQHPHPNIQPYLSPCSRTALTTKCPIYHYKTRRHCMSCICSIRAYAFKWQSMSRTTWVLMSYSLDKLHYETKTRLIPVSNLITSHCHQSHPPTVETVMTAHLVGYCQSAPD